MKGTIMEACVPTGAQVESNDGFFGLELLARVAEASGEPLGSAEVPRTGKARTVKQNDDGLRKETRKTLELALAKFKDCQEKLQLVQGRLADDQRRVSELLVKWNEADGHYQIGQENKMDRIYTINIWIRRNYQVGNPIANESDEKFQVNLMSSRDKILSSRCVQISGSNRPTGLRVYFKSSALKFYNFLENACIKIKPSKGEERQVGFLELPDRIATSSEIEFSTRNQTEIKEQELSHNFKLNILMYLELSSRGKREGVFPDEMFRRKFELSLGDQDLLPLCWSLKKNQERNRLIEFTPKSSDRDDSLVPLDLTRKSQIIRRKAKNLNTEGNEKNQTRSTNSVLRTEADRTSLMLSLTSEATIAHNFSNQTPKADSARNQTLSLGFASRKETRESNQEVSTDSDVGLVSDQRKERWSPDPEPRMNDIEIQTDSEDCQKDTLQAARPWPSKLSVVSPVESSILRTPPNSKRHKRLTELEEMIKALDKNLAEFEEQKKTLKKSKQSPLSETVQEKAHVDVSCTVLHVKTPVKTYGAKRLSKDQRRYGNYVGSAEL